MPSADAVSCSVIIPVLNEAPVLTPLLQDIRARYPQWECIVVDGGSSDNTVALAMALADVVLTGERGRAVQMNLGARAAQGDYLCFLHADTRPTVTAQEMQAVLAADPAWGFCRVRLQGAAPALRVIERAMTLRSRLTRIATGDQMLFLRRDIFEYCGGFAPLSLMEDVELCKRLRTLAPPSIIKRPVITSSRRWESHGILRVVVQMWMLRLAYFLGVSTERLARYYHAR